MSQDNQLSELQVSIMRILWNRKEATVADVHADLHKERGLAMTTVATLLSRLDKRGLIDHRTRGRQFVYRPLVTEHEIQSSMVSELIHRLFSGKPQALLSHLLTKSDISSGDLEKVKTMIEQKESGNGESSS